MQDSENLIENPSTKMEMEEDNETTKNSSIDKSHQSNNNQEIVQYNNNCLIIGQPSCIVQKRKYVKKSLAEFIEKSILTKSQINLNKSQNVMAVPLYESINETIEFILIGGDFIYKINSDNNNYIYQANDISNSNEKQESILQYQLNQRNESDMEIVPYKEVINVTKEQAFIRVRMCNKIDGLHDFRSLIGPINSQMSERTGQDHLQMLLQYQESMNRQYSAIDRVIKLFPDRNTLILQQQRRFEYISKFGLRNILSKFSEDEFLCVGIWVIDFDQKTSILQSVAFNQPLVSLIGTDFDQLQNYFLRKGIKEFFDFQTRVNLQIHHIRGLVDKQNQLFKQPFTLLTYDDMKIECTVEIETLFIEMPDELKYCQDENPFDIVEGGFWLHLILEDDQLKKIIDIRSQMEQEEIQRDQQRNNSGNYKKEEDICYNMQAQYFIEKFYQNQLKDILKSSVNSNSGSVCDSQVQEESKELDPFFQERCKYKHI